MVTHLALIASVFIASSTHTGSATYRVNEDNSNSSLHEVYSFKRNDARKEKLSELYFQHQLKQRIGEPTINSYTSIDANYPCLYGITPIGQDDKASAEDGHKFACGIHHISSRPIVYSFGSNRQQDFEKSILFYRPDALVYTFEINPDHLPPVKGPPPIPFYSFRKKRNQPELRDPRIVFTVLGLGPPSDGPVKMMLVHDIMKMLNHTHVDILKIDIEGGEHPWVKAEPTDTFTRIGQLLLEIHNFFPGKILIEEFNQKRTILFVFIYHYCFYYSLRYATHLDTALTFYHNTALIFPIFVS